jgi:hypothetical protein
MPTIEEVIRRSEQGVHRPFLCKADDGKEYFVKGRASGYQTLIKEIVAGAIGRLFDLPVPPCMVIHVPRELVIESAFSEIHELGYGPAFASEYVEFAQELSSSIRPKVSTDLRAKTFLFDWWIMNQDRTLVGNAGNPNLLWTAQQGMMHVIDHGSAFDRQFERETFLRTHAFREDRFYVLDRVFRSEREERMHEILRDFDSIWAKLPEEWLDPDIPLDPELVLDAAEIRIILQRFETEEFWEVLNI